MPASLRKIRLAATGRRAPAVAIFPRKIPPAPGASRRSAPESETARELSLPRNIPSTRLPRTFEGQRRFFHVDERTEFVDVGVTVTVKRVERVEIQRGGNRFCRQRGWLVKEIVIAVDQDPGRFVGNDLRQLVRGDIRQRQMFRAFDVK